MNPFKKLFVFFSLILLAISVSFVWLHPTSNCDLSIGIAQGKDVIDGKIGKADDWSYMTQNKICMNQNWGADLLLFLTNSRFGGNGLIVLKFLLISLVAIFFILILVRIDIPCYFCAIFPATIFVLASALFQLRPDIIGILLFLLFLLLLVLAHKKRFTGFIIPLVLLVWTNAHGSYIFGFGLFILYIALNIVLPKHARILGPKDILRLGIVLVVSMALSIAITPYGLNGITIPFRFLSSNYSLYKKTLYEWQPIWMNSSYGDVNGFWVGIGLFVLAGGIRFITRFRNAQNKVGGNIANGDSEYRPTSIFFEFFFSIGTLVTIAMAVSSRRFITYALIFIAITSAIYLKQIFRSIRFSRIVLAAINITLIAIAGRLLWVSIEQYPAINTAGNNGTFYERMFFVNPDYPVNLAKFMAENRISGNIFCYWTWEGYLHYFCPRLKVFAGGRAHQIYDNSIFGLYLQMLDKNPPISSLEKLNTSYIAMPSRYKFAVLIKALFADPNWAVLYADDRDILFAFKKLVPDTVSRSHLVYPDSDSKNLSSYALALEECPDVTMESCIHADSIIKTNYVCPWYYFLKTERFAAANGNKQKFVGNLLGDLNRFIYIASGNGNGLNILESTDDILQTLIEYYRQAGMPEKVNSLIPYLEIQRRIPIKR